MQKRTPRVAPAEVRAHRIETVIKVLGAAIVALALVVGCGGSKDGGGTRVESLPIPQFLEMLNIERAPEPMKTAAKAVVRIKTPGSFGTGFFVNDSGMLITNNHVLGANDDSNRCAQEGCYIQISENFQIGTKSKTREVLAVPLRVRPDLDAALFQLHEVDWRLVVLGTKKKIRTPFFLELSTATDLRRGDSANIVGHPNAATKKWIAGSVETRRGPWAEINNYALPGASGSPLLDDSGKVIGLVHRVRADHGNITRHALVTATVVTALPALRTFLAAPNDISLFPKLTDNVKLEDVSGIEDTYKMALVKDIKVDGAPMTMLEALGKQCDANLATDPTHPNKVAAAIRPCMDAGSWISCERAADSRIYTCPKGLNRVAWTARFDRASKIAARVADASTIPLLLEPSTMETDRAKAARMRRDAVELFAASEALDFELATALAAHVPKADRGLYDGITVEDLALNFDNVPGYGRHFFRIVNLLNTLKASASIDEASYVKAVNRLLDSGQVTLSNWLRVETLNYEQDKLSIGTSFAGRVVRQ